MATIWSSLKEHSTFALDGAGDETKLRKSCHETQILGKN